VLAILCAIANLGAIGVAAFLMSFFATFPWENLTPEEQTADDWLVLAAIVLAASALGLVLCVVMSWQRLGVVALAVQTVVSLSALAYALEGSSHSDGKLLGFAFAVELAAVGALVLSRSSPRPRPGAV